MGTTPISQSPDDIPPLARLVSGNQLILPVAVAARFPEGLSFEVGCEDSRIVLTPVHSVPADAVRSILKALGITVTDVADAVKWGRAR